MPIRAESKRRARGAARFYLHRDGELSTRRKAGEVRAEAPVRRFPRWHRLSQRPTTRAAAARPPSRPALWRPAWWAPSGFAAIPTAALDPPHSAASPAVPALVGSGSPSKPEAAPHRRRTGVSALASDPALFGSVRCQCRGFASPDQLLPYLWMVLVEVAIDCFVGEKSLHVPDA